MVRYATCIQYIILFILAVFRIIFVSSNSRCPVGDRCTNRRFQNRENASLKVFYADKKGCGVEAAADIIS